jgi:hypothetical protein
MKKLTPNGEKIYNYYNRYHTFPKIGKGGITNDIVSYWRAVLDVIEILLEEYEMNEVNQKIGNEKWEYYENISRAKEMYKNYGSECLKKFEELINNLEN